MKIFVHDKEECLIGLFFKCLFFMYLDYDFANRNVRVILYFDRLVMKMK